MGTECRVITMLVHELENISPIRHFKSISIDYQQQYPIQYGAFAFTTSDGVNIAFNVIIRCATLSRGKTMKKYGVVYLIVLSVSFFVPFVGESFAYRFEYLSWAYDTEHQQDIFRLDSLDGPIYNVWSGLPLGENLSGGFRIIPENGDQDTGIVSMLLSYNFNCAFAADSNFNILYDFHYGFNIRNAYDISDVFQLYDSFTLDGFEGSLNFNKTMRVPVQIGQHYLLTPSIWPEIHAANLISAPPFLPYMFSSDADLNLFVSPIGIPEPSTMLLLGSGLVGLAGYGRRRLKK